MKVNLTYFFVGPPGKDVKHYQLRLRVMLMRL